MTALLHKECYNLIKISGVKLMVRSSVKLSKIWEDIDFFELRMEFIGLTCKSNIDIYTTNEEIKKLKIAINSFSRDVEKEIIWMSGNDDKSSSHFLLMRFFKLNNRGYVGIEILADNKEEIPFHMRSNFSITTQISQLDDFTSKLEQLINGEIREFESIIPEYEF